MGQNCRVIYCHCAHARIISDDVKKEVLEGLCRSEMEWEAVSDLCEMAARKDPALAALVNGQNLKIAACYPRAVKWLLSSTGKNVDISTIQVCNMRTQTGGDVLGELEQEAFEANLPEGKGKAPVELIEESSEMH